MAVPTEALTEFKQLWLQEYGKPIDDRIAEKVAVKLLTMMKPIYKKIPKNANLGKYLKLNDYEKNNK